MRRGRFAKVRHPGLLVHDNIFDLDDDALGNHRQLIGGGSWDSGVSICSRGGYAIGAVPATRLGSRARSSKSMRI